MSHFARIIFVLTLLASFGFAHGGSYRGPTPGGGNRNPGGSGTPGPGSRGGAGNTTQGRDLRQWESWWSLNKEDWFPTRGVARLTVGGDDSGYAVVGPRAPTAEEVARDILPLLRELLAKERDPNIRDAAALALGKVGGDAEVDLLAKLLGDKERTVREASILGLGLLRVERAEKVLEGLAKDTGRPARERGLAIEALALSAGSVAKAFLTDGLGTTQPLQRARGGDLESLRAIGVGLIGKNDLAPPRSAPRTCAETGFLVAGIDKDLVKESDFLALAYAALAKTRDPLAEPVVMRGLLHPKASVRAGAAIAAGRVLANPDGKRVRELQALLANEGDAFTWRLLVMSIGRMGGDGAKQILRGVHQGSDQQNRAFAALALGVAHDKDSLPTLRQGLASANDSSLTGAYAIALSLIGDPADTGLLLRVLEEKKDPFVQSHVIQGLIVRQDPAAISAVEAILVRSKNPEVQAAAGLFLGLLGNESTTNTLLALLEQSGTLSVRAAVAAGLGRRGDKSAIDPLAAFAKNPTKPDFARAFAVAALGILGDKSPALPPFARFAIDAHYGVRHEVLEELRDIL